MTSRILSLASGRSTILLAALALILGVLPPEWTLLAKSSGAAIGETPKIPVGTVLPVSLEHDLSSKDLVKGEAIEGRLAQDVPLPDKAKIPAGSKLHGAIVNVVSPENGPASITLRFTSLESKHANYSIVVALRAMATFEAVQSAQLPYQEGASGSPAAWATTLQIGGDVRYGDGGKVTSHHNRKIGKATTNAGVLGPLEDDPGSPCSGWPDATHGPQALWVFSASACGTYDMKPIRIAHPGNKEPLGEITLTKDGGEIKLMKSSGLLLRVVQ